MVDKDPKEALVDKTPERPKNSSGAEILNALQINYARDQI